MKETYYQFDKAQFKKYAKAYYAKNPDWKKKNAAAMLVVALGIAVMVVPPAFFITEDIVIALAFLVCGVIFGSIPLIVGIIMQKKAQHKFGQPFDGMCKMFLFSNYSGIQFGYHDKYDKKSQTSAIVYQIAYPNIHSVDVNKNEHKVTVYGAIERVDYDDLMAERIRGSLTKGELGDRGSFAFFLCFDKQEEFFENLKEHKIRVNFV